MEPIDPASQDGYRDLQVEVSGSSEEESDEEDDVLVEEDEDTTSRVPPTATPAAPASGSAPPPVANALPENVPGVVDIQSDPKVVDAGEYFSSQATLDKELLAAAPQHARQGGFGSRASP